MNSFDEIRRLVLRDPSLMAALTTAETDAILFDQVLALAREHGIELSLAELQQVATGNRRRWLERWLP